MLIPLSFILREGMEIYYPVFGNVDLRQSLFSGRDEGEAAGQVQSGLWYSGNQHNKHTGMFFFYPPPVTLQGRHNKP